MTLLELNARRNAISANYQAQLKALTVGAAATIPFNGQPSLQFTLGDGSAATVTLNGVLHNGRVDVEPEVYLNLLDLFARHPAFTGAPAASEAPVAPVEQQAVPEQQPEPAPVQS